MSYTKYIPAIAAAVAIVLLTLLMFGLGRANADFRVNPVVLYSEGEPAPLLPAAASPGPDRDAYGAAARNAVAEFSGVTEGMTVSLDATGPAEGAEQSVSNTGSYRLTESGNRVYGFVLYRGDSAEAEFLAVVEMPEGRVRVVRRYPPHAVIDPLPPVYPAGVVPE